MRDLLSNLDPTVDPCDDKQIRKQIHDLCVEYVGGIWKETSTDQIELQKIKGATSNILFLCALRDQECKSEEPTKILLRVYFNPDKESSVLADTVIFTLLSERGLGPKLFGVFDDGRLEEYINSRPLSTSEIAIPNVSKVIAQKLAQIHKLHVPIGKKPDYLEKAMQRWHKQICSLVGRSHQFKTPELFWSTITKVLTLDDLAAELTEVKEFLKQSTSTTTFCHNDLQEGNVLIPLDQVDQLENGGDLELVFIDFEYSSYNFRGFDFANHFIEYSLCYDVEKPPYYRVGLDAFPCHEQMARFMFEYLKILKPDQPNKERSVEAAEMVDESLPFVPISHFFWGLWALLQAEVSPLTFGFKSYAFDRLHQYFATKSFMR